MFRSVTITLTLCLATVAAQAALLGRVPLTPSGTDYQAYYDDVLNITWIGNTNLAESNTFGVLGIVPDGRMTWDQANEWIVGMNAVAYLGKSDWRLPEIVDTGTTGCVDFVYSGTDCGMNVDVATSELAHLYYSTLGNQAVYDNTQTLRACASEGPNFCLTNLGPFANLGRNDYWSSTEYLVDPPYNSAWFFSFHDGGQVYRGKGEVMLSWAVRSGDFSVVPIPAAIWLFGSALGAVVTLRRKNERIGGPDWTAS